MAITPDLVIESLASLGGEAHLSDITARARQLNVGSWPVSAKAIIRARIEERSSDSQSYKRKENLFYSVHGVDARRGWWGLRNDTLSVSNVDGFLDEAEDAIEREEGRATLHIHLRRERSRALVSAFKRQLKSARCIVCDFDFGERYGDLGNGFCEAHHTIPVSKLVAGQKTAMSDLIAVCSNCHRMLHRYGLMNWRELKKVVLAETP